MTSSQVLSSNVRGAPAAGVSQEVNQFPEQTSASWKNRIVTELQHIKNDAANGYSRGVFGLAENHQTLRVPHILAVALGANLIFFPTLEKYGLNESIFDMSLGEGALFIGAAIAFQFAVIPATKYGLKTAGAVSHTANGIAKRSGIIN